VTTRPPSHVARGRAWLTDSRDAAAAVVLVAILLVALALAARQASTLFYPVAAVCLVTLAVLSWRWPHGMLLVVVFTPIFDRYLFGLLVPEELTGVTNYLSEALLAIVAAVITARGLRDGTLLPALLHPTVLLIAGLGIVGAVSAAVNGVPPLIAVLGLVFTIDAAVLFVLPRVIGFTMRRALIAGVAFSTLAALTALLALGQTYLHPDLLGMQTFTGRFAEGRRIAAFLVNPNMLGAVLALGTPLPLVAAVRAPTGRLRLLAGSAAFVLILALLYTFSRGAWLGLALAIVALTIFVDWRVLLLAGLVAMLAFGTASVMPRHLLDPTRTDLPLDLGGVTLGRLETIGEGDLRVRFIQNAAPIIEDHPIVGAGPGRYGGAVAWRFPSPLYDEYTAGRVPHDRTVDNFWLHIAVEFGAVGLILLLGAIAVAIWQTLRAATRLPGWQRAVVAIGPGMAIILGVDSLVEMLLEGNTTAFPMWFFLGISTGLVREAIVVRRRPGADDRQ
jgi:O-antigen ligase